jgi:Holliday junction resolvase
MRNPLSGSASRHTSGDVIHPVLYVECKYRKRSALWTEFHRVRGLARDEGKEPVLVEKVAGAVGETATVSLSFLARLLREAGYGVEDL